MTISVLDRTMGLPRSPRVSLGQLHDQADRVDEEQLPCRVNNPELWFAESPAGVAGLDEADAAAAVERGHVEVVAFLCAGDDAVAARGVAGARLSVTNVPGLDRAEIDLSPSSGSVSPSSAFFVADEEAVAARDGAGARLSGAGVSGLDEAGAVAPVERSRIGVVALLGAGRDAVAARGAAGARLPGAGVPGLDEAGVVAPVERIGIGIVALLGAGRDAVSRCTWCRRRSAPPRRCTRPRVRRSHRSRPPRRCSRRRTSRCPRGRHSRRRPRRRPRRRYRLRRRSRLRRPSPPRRLRRLRRPHRRIPPDSARCGSRVRYLSDRRR